MIYFLSYINNICSIYWMSPNIGSIGCQRIARIPPTPALSLSRSSLDNFCLNYVAVLLLLVSAVSNCFCFPSGHLKTCNITVTYFHKKENQTYTVVLCHVTLLPRLHPSLWSAKCPVSLICFLFMHCLVYPQEGSNTQASRANENPGSSGGGRSQRLYFIHIYRLGPFFIFTFTFVCTLLGTLQRLINISFPLFLKTSSWFNGYNVWYGSI